MSTANFVQETATAIGGTLGDGDVTLAAITGSPRFSSALGTAKRMANYVMQQTSTGKLERGIGYVANGVLTRSRVKETWDGAAYLPAPGSTALPVALQFGSSPAAGDIVVRIAPLADSFMPIPPAMQTSVGSPADGFRYSAHQSAGGTPGNANAFGTTQEWYVLYKNIAKGVLSGIEVNVKTQGSAGAVLKTALYEIGPNGLPGQCITQFNAIPVTTTGVKQDTIPATWSVPGPIPLLPDWFFVGFVCNDAAVIVENWGVSNIIEATPLGRADGYGNSPSVNKNVEVAGNLPAGIPAGTYTLNSQAGSRNYVFRLKVVPT